jgi:hypothetical protein
MVYELAVIGSEKHDDGCGVICPDNRIWKSAMEAGKITNLGDILDSIIVDKKPIPFHIRSATWGIEVTKENAHPFDGKHFILMHNGTLLPRDGEEPKDKKHDSDSLRFLNELDETKGKNPEFSFPDVFNKTMENFAGKFAFIIREKETGIDYIIRGRTAELWISTVKDNDNNIGYVINTSNITMKDAFHHFVNIGAFMRVSDGELKLSEPVLLKAETIYEAKSTALLEIGTTKEFTPVKKEDKKESKTTSLINRVRGEIIPKVREDSDIGKIIKSAIKIYEFLSEHSMTLLDLQIMFKIMGGLSLLETTMEDIVMFVDYMIPKISATKPLKTQVRLILNGKSFPNEVYGKYNLEYPWSVNDAEIVLNALKDYEGIKEK